MTEPVRPLEALIAEWRHVNNRGLYGRGMRRCSDELEAALLQAAAQPAPTAEDPFELLRQRQRDLPPDAAKVLLDNLWELYEGTPYPAALPERVSEGKEP